MNTGTGSTLGGTVALVAVLVLSAGCASVHHGRAQHVVVTSEPPGARIFANDEPVGVTPELVTVNRSGTLLRLEKNGFRTAEIQMPRAPSAWLAGSMVLAVPFFAAGSYWLTGAALILGVDLGTGGAWKFPKRMETALEPAVEAAARTQVNVAGESGTQSGHSAESGYR